jgi:hypothetical protein
VKEVNSIELREAIARVLWYFSYFKHPLTKEEVHKYLDVRACQEDVESELMTIVEDGKVFKRDEYFGLSKEHLDFRIEAQLINTRWFNIAKRMSQLILTFPFVRSVFVSGSLSKSGLTGNDDDIDYFLITSPDRVWTAKFLLMAFKKVFLFNSKKFFCINLLRDEEHLQFHKENVYIATEILSLKPMSDLDHLDKLLAENAWITKFFPNAESSKEVKQMDHEFTVFERVLNSTLGDRFEEWCRLQFAKHVERQKERRNAHFETSAHSSAYFPDSMEQKILNHYHSKPLNV